MKEVKVKESSYNLKSGNEVNVFVFEIYDLEGNKNGRVNDYIRF